MKVEVLGTQQYDRCGTTDYKAPELWITDNWAIGCIIYEMLVGTAPFKDRVIFREIAKIKKAEYDIPPSIPDQQADMIRSILNVQPNQRKNSPQ